jgi:hypothetical protein
MVSLRRVGMASSSLRLDLVNRTGFISQLCPTQTATETPTFDRSHREPDRRAFETVQEVESGKATE